MHLEKSALKLSNLKPDALERRGDTVLQGEHMIVAPPPCVPWNIKFTTYRLRQGNCVHKCLPYYLAFFFFSGRERDPPRHLLRQRPANHLTNKARKPFTTKSNTTSTHPPLHTYTYHRPPYKLRPVQKRTRSFTHKNCSSPQPSHTHHYAAHRCCLLHSVL
jgi:hypothetical protein